MDEKMVFVYEYIIEKEDTFEQGRLRNYDPLALKLMDNEKLGNLDIIIGG